MPTGGGGGAGTGVVDGVAFAAIAVDLSPAARAASSRVCASGADLPDGTEAAAVVLGAPPCTEAGGSRAVLAAVAGTAFMVAAGDGLLAGPIARCGTTTSTLLLLDAAALLFVLVATGDSVGSAEKFSSVLWLCSSRKLTKSEEKFELSSAPASALPEAAAAELEACVSLALPLPPNHEDRKDCFFSPTRINSCSPNRHSVASSCGRQQKKNSTAVREKNRLLQSPSESSLTCSTSRWRARSFSIKYRLTVLRSKVLSTTKELF